MNIVYISGKYRSRWGIIGRIINIWKAGRAAIQWWQEGYAVICPHTNTLFGFPNNTDTSYLDGCLEIINRLHKKDTIYMLKNWGRSEGANAELKLAMSRGLQVIFQEEQFIPITEKSPETLTINVSESTVN